ncbi:MAG: PQQ-binding-like beta-propeller repeat protein [Chloroflexi bacterium]|nr:PQQ-binding-like beta-propeller repeat protein [Chloroflexota bacterium]
MLAGGAELPKPTESQDRAKQYLSLHNLTSANTTITTTVSTTRIANDTLTVSLIRPVDMTFLNLVGIHTVNVSATATVWASSWAGDQTYDMFRGSASRTGSQTCTSLDSGVEAVGYEWGYRWDLHDVKNHRSTPAIYADPSIHSGDYVAYVGSNGTNASTPPAADAGVYAFDGDTGAQLWHVSLGTKVRSSPLVAKVTGLNSGYPVVFVAGHNGKVYALDARDGHTLWVTANNNDSYEDDGKYHSSPALVNGSIYHATSRGNVYKVDAVTGAMVWRSTPYPGTSPYLNPNIPANWVTTTWGDTPCTAFDADGNCTNTATGGEPAWWGYTPIYGTVAISNDAVFMADHGGKEWGGGGSRQPRIYAISATDGSKLWTSSTTMDWQNSNDNNRQSPTVANVDTNYDGAAESLRVFGAPTDGYLYAYDANTGVELWHAYTGQLNHRADPVFFCEALFGGNGDESSGKAGGVWALEAVGGKSIWDGVDNDGAGPDQANPEFTGSQILARAGGRHHSGRRQLRGGEQLQRDRQQQLRLDVGAGGPHRQRPGALRHQYLQLPDRAGPRPHQSSRWGNHRRCALGGCGGRRRQSLFWKSGRRPVSDLRHSVADPDQVRKPAPGHLRRNR